MEIKYDAWMKEVITEALKETAEHNLCPAKITFEKVEYESNNFLAEVQQRTLVGEMFLQRIYDGAKVTIERNIESFLEHNPDEPWCDVPQGKAPTRRQIYEKISNNIRTNTQEGKDFLTAIFGAYITDSLTPQKYDPLDMDIASGKEDVDDDDLF